jgi:CheY-like chemotaxis protein
VLINLVGNAVKFTGQGQVLITLGGEVTGSRLACTIAVSDTGIGIPPDQLHRLFRSFTQVDTSPTRSYGGTGLGLAISQRITRAMGGDIAVQSEPGLGSTFTVTVELGVAAAGDERRSLGDLAGLRLLVVDDNPTNLRILEDQVTGLGGQCVLAAGGAAALEHLDADVGPFDACLLDLHMPGMNGDELAARLRAHPATATVPLVLLSSSNRLHAGGGPFAARLHKPIRPERLLRTLLSILPPRHSGARRRPVDVVTPSEALAMPCRLRVLVAEDQAVNAHLMALYLQQLGHDSDHVDNGERAVEAVRTGNFDVVLMDAQMPVLGGVDATAAIRCLPGPQPRIIAVTASVLPGDRAAFLAAGADEFLSKPVRLSTLRES